MTVKIQNSSLSQGFPAFDEKTKMDSKQETLLKLQKVQQSVSLIGKAIKSPTRSTSASLHFFRGIYNILTGSPFSGIAEASLGGIELYLIFSQNQTVNMKELLEDTDAGLEMIKHLEEENGKTLKSLQNKVTFLNDEISALSGKIDQVKAIATKGNQQLEQLKQEALNKYQVALDSQAQALNQLSEVKTSLENGTSILREAKENIYALKEKALEPASNDSAQLEQQFNEFKTLSDSALNGFAKAEKFLNQSSSQLLNSIDLIQTSYKNHSLATEAAVKASMTAEKTLEEVITHLEHQKEINQCKNTIQSINEQLEELSERNQEMNGMLQDASDNVHEAQEQIVFGLQSVILGGGLGALLGPCVGIPSCASGPAGAMLYHDLHNGGPVAVVAGKAYELVEDKIWTKPKEEPLPPVILTENMKFTFDRKSSGWFGWFQGRRSHTVGTLELSISGKAIFDCKINFNKKKPMSVTDIKRLRDALALVLKQNPEKADEVERVMTELRTSSVSRYSNKNAQEFISEKSIKTYFGEIRREIKKIRKEK